jgi:hypothetical protein
MRQACLPLEGRQAGALTFGIWFLTFLTFSGGFYLESSNELFQFFFTTFWAFGLPTIMLSDAEDGSEFLFTFRASIVVAGHSLSLLSPCNLNFFV